MITMRLVFKYGYCNYVAKKYKSVLGGIVYDVYGTWT